MKKFITLFVWLVIIANSIALLCVACTNRTNKEIISYEKYIVQSGDTLTSIAKTFSENSEKYDIREVIWDIEDYNNCTALIRVGQVLMIPQYAE